jgi:hypothetical protein
MNSLNLSAEGFVRPVMTAVAKLAAIPFYRRKLRRFQAMLADAHRVQRASLFRRINYCAQSDFGRIHGFSQIKNIDDFRRQVPISTHEYFAPYIDEVSRGRKEALFPPEERVLSFSCTTGTTGVPKLNPVTVSWLNEYRRSLELWGVKAIVEHPEMIGTRVLQLLGPGNLGTTPSGLSIGMASAIAARYQNPIYKSFYAVPAETADIGDSLAKYYTTARLSMASTVGFLISITPANLIRLAQFGNEHREQLIRDIHDGTLWDGVNVPAEFRRRIARTIRVRQPRRARMLEQIVERTGTLYPKDYWPLSLISCWLGGTIGYQARNLPMYYGDTPTRDLGLISTEGRHTIPLEDGRPEGVLAVDGAYYEFIPISESGSASPQTLECHELEPGAEYSIVMTTSSGFYRFEIGDVVRCIGYQGQSPILQFLHKSGQCADLEGEKISGFQVSRAVEVAAHELSLSVDCFMAVPVRPEGQTPYYAFLIERHLIDNSATSHQFLRILDRELIRQNVMYAGKRNDGYIDSPRLMRLAAGTWSAFAAVETSRTKSGDSQYKQVSLVPDMSWLDRFQPLDTVRLDSAS